MLPLDTGPEWMRIVSKANPLTYVVDAERTLFTGTLWHADVLWARWPRWSCAWSA